MDSPQLHPPKFTAEERLEHCWRRGILVPWLCHDAQKRMAAGIDASTSKKYVINSARRLGKSYLLCCLALEYAIKNKNAQIKYAADTQRSVKKIIVPLMRQLLDTCPKQLRPKFRGHDGVYEFPNGSEIHIAGAGLDQADSLRGTSCDLAIVDEAGFVPELEYLVDSILMPQTLTRPNARIIMASTPPVSPDHPFVSRYMKEAMEKSAYSRFTIYDNPLLSAERIAEFMAEAGGEESTTWRREYLAEVVTELKNALFPEVTQGTLLDDLVYDVKRPPFIIPITVLDLGYLDFTGILFGYYHFPLAKVVIEDEILINKTTSDRLVEMVRAKEKELWNGQQPQVRIVDGNSLAIADLNAIHSFSCRTPEKSDLPANVNRVRIDLDQRRLVFHPRCTNTIAQVRYATWDKNRTGFSRNSGGGHWDLAAALIYLLKHVDRNTNPIPASYGFDQWNDFGYPRKHKNTSADNVLSMFPAFRKRPPT